MSAKNFSRWMHRAGLPLRLLVLVSLASGAARTQAQQSKTQQKADEEEVVTVRSRLVNVDVSVKDKKGNYVNDLKAEDFAVYENGVRQKVEFFNPPLAGSKANGGASKSEGAAARPADSALVTERAQAGMP